MTFVAAEAFSFGDAPILLFVDHASNAVPPSFNNLGLSSAVLTEHVGWDIGAEALARVIAEDLNAKVACCRFSRLLIDPNRSLANPALIPSESDDIIIPGNQNLSDEACAERVTNFYEPYHDALGGTLDEIQTNHAGPLIISVHSFTPKLSATEEKRPWHISLLWKDDEDSARAVMRTLRDETEYVIGDNEPYSGALYNFTVDKHVGPRGLRHLTFEVRQDMISDARGVAEIAGALGPAIQNILAE